MSPLACKYFLGYILLILQVGTLVFGYPQGSLIPTSVCNTRVPLHGIGAQSSPVFTLSSQMAGTNVEVSITSTTYTNIKGFFIQGRMGDMNGVIVGTWYPQANTLLKQCTSAYDTIAHLDRNDKSLPLGLLWKPPEDLNSLIVFVATIVVSRSTFWVDVTSQIQIGSVLDACNPSQCENGVCQLLTSSPFYRCLCNTGFTGYDCDTEVCNPNPCQNLGTCLTGANTGYLCDCIAGYHGADCETDACSQCQNGDCQRLDFSPYYSCLCNSGFTGTNCDTDINECGSNPCGANGVCMNLNNAYFCNCNPGYSGTNCEIDSCSTTPCVNGNCIPMSSSPYYMCNCNSGFTGTNCQTPTTGTACDSGPCMNGATCSEVSNGYMCQCASGYEGNQCATNIDECSSNPCGSNGACMDSINSYTCTCNSGFLGTNCENDINECSSNPCGSNGACMDNINSYTCTCNSGFSGTNCENDIDECNPNPCQNQGECTDGVNMFNCTCPADFSGTVCQTQGGSCASSPCMEGGTCKNQQTGFICECPDGYRGLTCELVDFCYDNQCLNQAICISSDSEFFCSCQDGYKGETCSDAVSEESDPVLEWYWVALLGVFGLFMVVLLVGIYCVCKQDSEPPTYY